MTFDREQFLNEAGTSSAELEEIRAFVEYARSLRRGDVRRTRSQGGAIIWQYFDGGRWTTPADGLLPGTPLPLEAFENQIDFDRRPRPPSIADAGRAGRRSPT